MDLREYYDPNSAYIDELEKPFLERVYWLFWNLKCKLIDIFKKAEELDI